MKQFDLKYIVNPVQYSQGTEKPKFRSYYIANMFCEREKLEKVSKGIAGEYWYIVTAEERKRMIDLNTKRLD